MMWFFQAVDAISYNLTEINTALDDVRLNLSRIGIIREGALSVLEGLMSYYFLGLKIIITDCIELFFTLGKNYTNNFINNYNK
jgi:hypothetical protein